MRLITVLDTETTGKKDKAHRIIELSMRLCDLDTLTEKRNIKLRFNPERNIDAKAFDVHGISIEELKHEPLFCEKIADIKKVLELSTYVVGHNYDFFDGPMLENEFERCDVPFPVVESFDTMIKGSFATDLGKSPSLMELCYSLGVDYDPKQAHAGDYDTEVLRDCLFNGIRYGWWQL